MPDDQMKWRLPENLTVTRSDGRLLMIKIAQDGNTLVGTAHSGPDGGLPEMTGAMSGSVQGDTINLTIYWPDNSIADLHGMLSGDGLARGTTVDRSKDDLAANWSAEPAAWGWE